MKRRTWLLALMLLALPACSEDGTTEPENALTGTYTIQTFNGHALPYTNGNEVLVSGTLLLNTNDTYTVQLTSHLTNGDDNSWTESGTYTVTGTAIALRSSDGSITNGVFGAASTITIQGDDGIYVVKKN